MDELRSLLDSGRQVELSKEGGAFVVSVCDGGFGAALVTVCATSLETALREAARAAAETGW